MGAAEQNEPAFRKGDQAFCTLGKIGLVDILRVARDLNGEIAYCCRDYRPPPLRNTQWIDAEYIREATQEECEEDAPRSS